MITAGGDGTVLKVAKACAKYGVPVMGINLGHVGFLAEEEPDKLGEAIAALTSGNYELESRTLLCAKVNDKSFVALNDAVISRLPQSRILETDVYVNGEFADRYHSDGYIVSTPTGSTAYSLSAGGSILCPGVAAFILTPINSHSLHSRPLVVSENDEVTVKPHGECSLVVDGIEKLRLRGGDEVKIVKNDVSVKFVRLRWNTDFTVSARKLNKWSVYGRRLMARNLRQQKILELIAHESIDTQEDLGGKTQRRRVCGYASHRLARYQRTRPYQNECRRQKKSLRPREKRRARSFRAFAEMFRNSFVFVRLLLTISLWLKCLPEAAT